MKSMRVEGAIVLYIYDPRLFLQALKILRRRGVVIRPYMKRTPPGSQDLGPKEIVVTDLDLSLPSNKMVRISASNITEELEKAVLMVMGREKYEELLIGVDPGLKPAYVVLGDGRLVEKGVLETEELVKRLIELVGKIPSERIIIRVGDQGPNMEDIIISLASSLPQHVIIEVVDEKNTSEHEALGFNAENKDVNAALKIVFRRGVKIVH